jgi:hypothetical protein
MTRGSAQDGELMFGRATILEPAIQKSYRHCIPG